MSPFPKQKKPSQVEATDSPPPPRSRTYQVRLFLVFFTVVHFAACFLHSHDKPLWLDELFTFHIANRPTVGAVIDALETGAETHPPATYLLGHALIPWLGDADGIRFPAMVGFWVMGLCVFFTVLRCYNFLGAVLAVALPYVIGPFYYAYEGRAYGILLGCAGLAFLSWTRCRREDGGSIWFFVLPLAVATAIWSHFYAVLIAIPLLLGEAYSAIHRRQLRWRIWIALLAGYLALLPLLGIVRAIRSNVQVDRSRNVYWLAFAFVYEELFNNFGAFLVLCFILLATLAVWSRVVAGRRQLNVAENTTGFGKAELIAAFAFSLMPLWVEILCSVVAGFYLPRHAMMVVFGFSLLLLPVLWLAGTPHRAVLLTLIGACLVIFAAQQALLAKRVFLSNVSMVVRQKVLPAIPIPGDLAVAVQDPRVCLRWQYYAPLSLRSRFRYLGSARLGLAYTGASVMDRAMLGLQRITPVQVQPYEEFIADHRRFLVYWDAAPPEQGAGGWLVPKLLDSHAELRLLAEQGSQFLYLATLPPSAEAPGR